MTDAKILVIDDEQSIVDLATAYLHKEGYEVHVAMDGPAGLKAARSLKPDLIVLDIMLPGLDGLELLNRLRRESDVYVIMLTAKSEETDKVVGLSVGADDYLTKPFSPRELVARVKAALRRIRVGAGAVEAPILAFRHVRIDTGRRQVWVDNEYDPQTPMACSEELARGIREAQLVIFERSGHYPFIEEREQFKSVLGEFLAMQQAAQPES